MRATSCLAASSPKTRQDQLWKAVESWSEISSFVHLYVCLFICLFACLLFMCAQLCICLLFVEFFVEFSWQVWATFYLQTRTLKTVAMNNGLHLTPACTSAILHNCGFSLQFLLSYFLVFFSWDISRYKIIGLHSPAEIYNSTVFCIWWQRCATQINVILRHRKLWEGKIAHKKYQQFFEQKHLKYMKDT